MEHYQSVKQFESRSGPTCVGPDLGPNCLLRLSADIKIRCRQAKSYYGPALEKTVFIA